MWENLPWIAHTSDAGGFDLLSNGPGCRPYIRYPFSLDLGCTYSGWRVRDNIGAIRFFDREIDFAETATSGLGDFIVVEPHLTRNSNPNKQWGWPKWQGLVDQIRNLNVIQMGPAGTKLLDGVIYIKTPTFRHAAAVLARAASSILPEGGLHHAAGVLGLPAVVLFGGAVDADAMGYDCHMNLAIGKACGNWKPCSHCAAIWDALSPDYVAERNYSLQGNISK